MISIIAVMLISWGCSVESKSSNDNLQQSQAPLPKPQPSLIEEREFQSAMSGSAKLEDGTPFSFHLYKSSDGRSVSTRFETRKSSILAEKELQRHIRSAVKVIELGPRLDENGRQVGQRAVLTTNVETSAETQITLLWSEGAHLHFVESNSLQNVLDFEKEYLRVTVK